MCGNVIFVVWLYGELPFALREVKGVQTMRQYRLYEAVVRCVCTCAHFRLHVLVFADLPFIIFVSCTKNTTKRNACSSSLSACVVPGFAASRDWRWGAVK